MCQATRSPLQTGVMGVGKLKASGSSCLGKPKAPCPTDTATGSSSSVHVRADVVLPHTGGMCPPTAVLGGPGLPTVPASPETWPLRGGKVWSDAHRGFSRAPGACLCRNLEMGSWGQRQRIPEPQDGPTPSPCFPTGRAALGHPSWDGDTVRKPAPNWETSTMPEASASFPT